MLNIILNTEKNCVHQIIKCKVSKNHIPQVSREIQLDDDVNQDKVSSQDISYAKYNSAKEADDATYDSRGITR
jgi:hypothetical protein